MTDIKKPLDPYADFVDGKRKVTPDWYSWLNELTEELQAVASVPIQVFDVRTIGATVGNNAQPYVATAYANGYRRFWLAKGIYYQGGGTVGGFPSTVIPAYATFICEDPRTTIIKAVDRTSTNPDGFIWLDNFATIINFGSQSYSGDQSPPAAIQKTCMMPYVTNSATSMTSIAPGQGPMLLICQDVTSPEGVVTTDVPGYQVSQRTFGDGIFVETGKAGVGIRIQTRGNTTGDIGLLIQDCLDDGIGFSHLGFYLQEFGTIGAGVFLQRMSGSTVPILQITDTGPATTAEPFIHIVHNYNTAGNTIQIHQGTTAFGGNFFFVESAVSGVGTFTGNYIRCDNNGATRFRVDSNGTATLNADVSLTAGGNPVQGLKFAGVMNIHFGSGAPTLSAPKGSLYLRSDGSTTNDRAYINTNGSTGWTAIITST